MSHRARGRANFAGSSVAEVERSLARITRCLVTLSRLHCLSLLSTSDRHAKLAAAEEVASYAEQAVHVEQFSIRHMQHKPGLVSWPKGARPDLSAVIRDGTIDEHALATLLAVVGGELRREIEALQEAIEETLLAAPVSKLLRRIVAQIDGFDEYVPTSAIDMSSPVVDAPEKVFAGPPRCPADPMFVPTYSLLDTPPSLFSNDLSKAVPYLWLECIRETLGADLCALNSAEYDGLPLAFYADMAKQAWDEMRHALYYLEASCEMIPELLEELDETDELAATLRGFLEGRDGLPVPVEGNLYEAVHNATLAERMLMFQVQTESAAAARKKHELSSDLCRSHPALRCGIEYDIRDEITHARIGKTWLAHLLPSKESRREAAATTALLRGMLILTSFAHGHRIPLVDVVDRCLSRPSDDGKRVTAKGLRKLVEAVPSH